MGVHPTRNPCRRPPRRSPSPLSPTATRARNGAAWRNSLGRGRSAGLAAGATGASQFRVWRSRRATSPPRHSTASTGTQAGACVPRAAFSAGMGGRAGPGRGRSTRRPGLTGRGGWRLPIPSARWRRRAWRLGGSEDLRVCTRWGLGKSWRRTSIRTWTWPRRPRPTRALAPPTLARSARGADGAFPARRRCGKQSCGTGSRRYIAWITRTTFSAGTTCWTPRR
mmetsp:Transcript_49858/g.131187  ORF Transcript_49858/g.131187 Transcript_49858/m.131187 type:complete len:224 (+) Transcript_49858:68-739(+)